MQQLHAKGQQAIAEMESIAHEISQCNNDYVPEMTEQILQIQSEVLPHIQGVHTAAPFYVLVAPFFTVVCNTSILADTVSTSTKNVLSKADQLIHNLTKEADDLQCTTLNWFDAAEGF